MNVVHLHSAIMTGTERLFHRYARIAATTRKIVLESIVIPSLKRNRSRVETVISNSNDLLVALLTDDNSRVTPREVILVPERVDGQHKAVDREGDDIDDHPSNVLPLSLDDEDDRLKTIHCSDHDNRDQRKLTGMRTDSVDEISKVNAGSGQDDGTKEVNEDHESHAETAETTKIFQEHQFGQIVDGRVDPSASLRQKD